MFPLPLYGLLIINFVLLGYAWSIRNRRNVSTFVAANALSLILYGVGQIMTAEVEGGKPALIILAVAALIVPANYFIFAVIHPEPLLRNIALVRVRLLLFLPPVLVPFVLDYTAFTPAVFGYRISVETPFDRDTFGWYTVGAYIVASLAAAFGIFIRRHLRSAGTLSVNLFKGLAVTIAGIGIFAGCFWIVTLEQTRGVLPAPTLLCAILAQAGTILVLRHEEDERPLLLSRLLFYATMIVGSFLLVSLFIQLQDFMIFRPIADTSWLFGVAILLAAILATLPTPQAWFDRAVFLRSYNYRTLVLETQRELRDAQERLRRAQRLSMLGEIAARVAHEIKNPLGPIRGYTQLLRDRVAVLDIPESQREQMLSQLAIIGEEVESINTRVQRFLELSRRPALIRQRVAPDAMITRTATLMRLDVVANPLGSVAIAVEVLPTSELPVLNVDRACIEEALYNLGRNALEAVGTRGRVTLSARRASSPRGEDGILMVVRDNGPGLSLEALDKVGTPFYTQKPGGTGLGISIARAHVTEHGGELLIRNHPEGGSEACIWLPIRDTAGPADQAFSVPNVKLPLEALPSASSNDELARPTPLPASARH